ncbi:MAG: hypothetical protein ABJE95_08205 [Byssovorax sp.]
MRDHDAGNRRRRPWGVALLAVFAATLLTFSPRRASALETLSDAEIEAMITSLARKVAADTEGDGPPIDAAKANLLIRLKTRSQALIDVDASCPITGTVANLSAHPLFNVVVTATESMTKTGAGIESTIHLAYLPAKSLARVSFPCKTSSLGYGTKYISGDGFGPATPLTPEGVDDMLVQPADCAASRTGTFSAADVKGTIADQVMEDIDDKAAFTDLVTALLKTERGGAVVGRSAARGSSGEKALWLAPLIGGATHAAAASAFDAMIIGGLDMTSKPMKPILDKLCGAGQPELDRAALWTRALAGIPGATAEARAAILKKCAGTAAQTGARLKMASAPQLAAALDALDGAGFDAALSATDGPPIRVAAIAGLLRATRDAKKLATVTHRYPLAGFTTGAAIRELVLGVAVAASGALDAEKAALVAGGLDRLHELAAPEADALAGELMALVAQGKIVAEPIRAVISEHAAGAGDAVTTALAAVVRDESRVLAPDWLMARAAEKKLDLLAFLTLNRASLRTCDTSLSELQECLTLLPTAAPGLSREAFTPAFVAATLAMINAVDGADDVASLAKSAAAVGLDPKPIVDGLCSKADKAARATKPDLSTAEALLSAAISIEPAATCVGEVRSGMRWRGITDAGSVALRFLVLMVIIALGTVYIRRSWSTVRGKIREANKEVENAQADGGGERRLDAATWTPEITAGIADLAQSLEGETSPDLRAAATLLREIPAEARGEIVRRARLAANTTLRTGDVSSLLVKLPSALVYVVCFAGRAEQPQTVRRHAAFRDGWEAHAARVREAAAEGSPGLPLLGLLFFLHADAVKGTLLIALEGDDVHVVPERLLGEREARGRAGQISRNHHDFELERASGAQPPAADLAAAEG